MNYNYYCGRMYTCIRVCSHIPVATLVEVRMLIRTVVAK